jgi:hypothetical protein
MATRTLVSREGNGAKLASIRACNIEIALSTSLIKEINRVLVVQSSWQRPPWFQGEGKGGLVGGAMWPCLVSLVDVEGATMHEGRVTSLWFRVTCKTNC